MEFLLIVLVTLQGDQPAAGVIIPPSQGNGDHPKQKRRGKAAAPGNRFG